MILERASGTDGPPQAPDPTLGVPVPSKSAPRQEKARAQSAHLRAARAQANTLADDCQAVPTRLHTCLGRLAHRTVRATGIHRSQALDELRSSAEALRDKTCNMIATAPDHVRDVLAAAGPGGMHIALIEHYVIRLGLDEDLIGHLLNGFPLIGDIPGDPEAKQQLVREYVTHPDRIDTVAAEAGLRTLLKCSESPPHDRVLADEIWLQTVAEIDLKRMTPLRRARRGIAARRAGSRRFGVRQRSSKGVWKTRCIDDFLSSGINGATRVTRRLRMGRFSDLKCSILQLRRAHPGTQLDILKSDFKSAYRAVPIALEHLHLARILVSAHDGEVWESAQKAMPFGAVAAVYAWDRLAAVLCVILLECFDIPVIRYVDDLFFIDFHSLSQETRSMLLEIISLLGLTLDLDKTPPPAPEQVLLGVSVELHPSAGNDPSPAAIHLELEPAKATFWRDEIVSILTEDYISPHQAQQLAGRLSFACWAIWGAAATARLSSLFSQAFGEESQQLSLELVDDLKWWHELLEHHIMRAVVPCPLRRRPVTLVYTDAEGAGGLGVVICPERGQPVWAATMADPDFVRALRPRKTQIVPLELVCIPLVLFLFHEMLVDTDLVFFIDNQSALGCVTHGRSGVSDINRISHLTRLRIHSLGVSVRFLWVPSALNPADPPSRGMRPPVGRGASQATPSQEALSTFWQHVTGCLGARHLPRLAAIDAG